MRYARVYGQNDLAFQAFSLCRIMSRIWRRFAEKQGRIPCAYLYRLSEAARFLIPRHLIVRKYLLIIKSCTVVHLYEKGRMYLGNKYSPSGLNAAIPPQHRFLFSFTCRFHWRIE